MEKRPGGYSEKKRTLWRSLVESPGEKTKVEEGMEQCIDPRPEKNQSCRFKKSLSRSLEKGFPKVGWGGGGGGGGGGVWVFSSGKIQRSWENSARHSQNQPCLIFADPLATKGTGSQGLKRKRGNGHEGGRLAPSTKEGQKNPKLKP